MRKKNSEKEKKKETSSTPKQEKKFKKKTPTIYEVTSRSSFKVFFARKGGNSAPREIPETASV